jgi:membrane protein implicated in regulation of membrane protease activity
MQAHSAGPSSADVAAEANTLSTGLGIITFALFPVAVPGLLFVVAPLALVAVVGLVLAIPLVLPLWLVRTVRRSRSRRGGPSGSPVSTQQSAGLVYQPGGRLGRPTPREPRTPSASQGRTT